jgi:hypothetical protein
MMFHFDGPHKAKGWTVMEAVGHANSFSRNVLLRGDQKLTTLRLVGGPLAVTPGFARHLKLQPAIEAGIVRVEAA